MEETIKNVDDSAVAQPTTTTSTTTSTTTQKSKEVELVKVVEEVKFHVRDFLLTTKAMRDEFNILEKKFLAFGLKTIAEWEKLTGLGVKK